MGKFCEDNWWKYGAIRNQEIMESNVPRFYAYAKTRSLTPFFPGTPNESFTGAIIGLFQTEKAKISMTDAVKLLNSQQYRKNIVRIYANFWRATVFTSIYSRRFAFPQNAKRIRRFFGTEIRLRQTYIR